MFSTGDVTLPYINDAHWSETHSAYSDSEYDHYNRNTIYMYL